MTSFAVVYLGGTCGQFVRNVLSSVLAETFWDLNFSKNGSAHQLHRLGNTRSFFSHLGNLDSLVDSIQTHSFIEIPNLATKHDKVIAITITSGCREEFIIRNVNLILKYYLEKHEPAINDVTYLRRIALEHLGTAYSSLATKIYDSRFDEEYKDICLYFLTKDLFNGNNYLLDLEVDTYGPADGAIQLPFKCIIDGDTTAFLNFVERVVGNPLSDKQRVYTRAMFERYYSSQNLLLLKHPTIFIQQTKEKALAKLKLLMQEYDQ